MKIELRKLSKITPYFQNPRLNNSAVEAVAASLKEFGGRQPIVVDEDGIVICGHTRLKAAERLGLADAPVPVAVGLTPEEVKAYRLADNKTAELAEWDKQLLALELTELQQMQFDLGLTGFSNDDLIKLLGGEVFVGVADPDDVPDPPDEAITQPGDLWTLTRHHDYPQPHRNQRRGDLQSAKAEAA